MSSARGPHSGGARARGRLVEAGGVRPAWFIVSLGLLAAACGQVSGTHTAGPAALAGGAPSPSVSPNGENSGPPAGTVTYQVVFTKVKKAKPATRTSPLAVCPVQGRGYIADDFGAPRYAGGYHPHQGNDIFAPLGTPVVAPFDGYAVRSPNLLGGNAVTVYGELGYAYNAHLSRYGKVGSVRAGETIGDVGNTGDAMGGPPHDHFEWHPGNGPAVDPHQYLRAACGV